MSAPQRAVRVARSAASGRSWKTVYLSQTVEKKDGKLRYFMNIEDAFEAWKSDPGPREWRTHFHIPVFLDDLGAFGTTRFALEQALAKHRETPLSQQLEIETYTWDVLPEHLKTGDIVEFVCREIAWVKGLTPGPPALERRRRLRLWTRPAPWTPRPRPPHLCNRCAIPTSAHTHSLLHRMRTTCISRLRVRKESENTNVAYRVAAFRTFLSGRI